MPEPKTRRKTEAHTAEPLTPPPRIEKDDAVQMILGKLFELATRDGNVSAAKLWLDVVLKRHDDDPEALTAEQALALLAAARPSAETMNDERRTQNEEQGKQECRQ